MSAVTEVLHHNQLGIHCQDMVFLNFYFSTNATLLSWALTTSLHNGPFYDPYDFTINEQERVYYLGYWLLVGLNVDLLNDLFLNGVLCYLPLSLGAEGVLPRG